MTTTQNIVAKAAVAFVAIAMAFTLVAPSAKAQDVSSMTLEQLIALVNQLQAQLSGQTGTAGSCSVTFTRSLGQGSTGADVMALQKFLNGSADTQVAVSGAGAPGTETSFYGPLTAAAVSKFQVKYSGEVLVPVGLSMPTGYFGPSSMAKANALCAAGGSTGGDTGGDTGGSTGDLKGGAGTISVTTWSSDVENEVATGDSENVLGFRVEADGSDIEATNMKISVAHTAVTSSSNRLERYFDSFDVVMEGKVVASVDADDFNRDSAGNYSTTVSLKDAIVREDDKNTFYVVAHARTSIDSNDAGSSNATWAFTADNLRYVDAQGAIISETLSSPVITNSGVYVIKLAASGEVKARISLSPSNPDVANVKVSSTTAGELVTLLEFRVKAEGTDMSFDTINFTIASSGTAVGISTMVSEFRLMRGSTQLDSETATTNAALAFSLDDTENVDQDETVTYKLVAKMNKNTFIGDSLTASFASIVIEDANGDTVSTVSGGAVGNAQTFRGDGLFAKINSTSANLLNTGGTSPQQYGEFVFTIDITADGDDFYVSSTTGATVLDFDILNAGDNSVYASEANTASSTITVSSNANVVANEFVVYDGETKQFVYTITMTPGAVNGGYRAVLEDLAYGTSVAAIQASSLTFVPSSSFSTGTVTIVQ
ncbi:MAG: hypothetical protein WD605_00005 [Candidatus Paceibacterota bacterium]